MNGPKLFVESLSIPVGFVWPIPFDVSLPSRQSSLAKALRTHFCHQFQIYTVFQSLNTIHESGAYQSTYLLMRRDKKGQRDKKASPERFEHSRAKPNRYQLSIAGDPVNHSGKVTYRNTKSRSVEQISGVDSSNYKYLLLLQYILEVKGLLKYRRCSHLLHTIGTSSHLQILDELCHVCHQLIHLLFGDGIVKRDTDA